MNDTAAAEHGVSALLQAGAAAIAIGAMWDISRDASIGIHAFSSPPHVTINAGGLAIAIAGFRLRRKRPIPASLALLGAGAMAAAEVFGLLRGQPPIVNDSWTALQLLAVAGMAAAVTAGVAHAAEMPGARGRHERAIATGMLLTFAATALGADSLPNLQRTALFFQLSAIVYPGILALALATDERPGAAAFPALVYMFAVALLVWLLPLIPATPATVPVFQPVDHMLPPRFPLLLVIPAVVFDLARRAVPKHPWARTPLLAIVFCATFVPAQWYFSAFLLSPASDSWFFAGGARHWPFFVEIGAERAMFWGLEQSPFDALALFRTTAYAFVSVLTGQSFGMLLRRGRAGGD